MKEVELLKEIRYKYGRRKDRLAVLRAYNKFIEEVKANTIITDVDKVAILFVFNVGDVTDISQTDNICKGIRLYDMMDPLNLSDTVGELFMLRGIIEEEDYVDDNYPGE